jgi:hypothetical protein
MGLPHFLFGTLREHYVLLFALASGFGLTFGFIGAWIGARFGARTAMRQSATDTTSTIATRADILAANEELQALVLEVERIAEGQRFVAKLLAERTERPVFPAPVARREPGEITPH